MRNVTCDFCGQRTSDPIVLDIRPESVLSKFAWRRRFDFCDACGAFFAGVVDRAMLVKRSTQNPSHD